MDWDCPVSFLVFLLQFDQIFEESSQFYCREWLRIAREQLLIMLPPHEHLFPHEKTVYRK